MTESASDEVAPPAAVAAVRAAESRLAELDELPVAAHVAIYDDVHAVLQDALAELDES